MQFRGKLDPVLPPMDGRSVSWIKKQHALFVSTHGKKGYPQPGRRAVRPRPVAGRSGYPRARQGDREAGAERALELDFVYVAAYWVQPRSGGAERAIAVRIDGTTYFLRQRAAQGDPAADGVLRDDVDGSRLRVDVEVPGLHRGVDSTVTQAGGTSSATAAVDPTDPDATVPDGCFINTSGF